MDLILRICDDLFFDKLWAHLVPLSAFTRSPDPLVSLNGSAMLPCADSTWSHLVSYLPHPPLPPDDLSSSILSYSSSISPSHAARLASAWPRDYILRQLLSLVVLTSTGIIFLYFTFAWLSYKFIFNHDMMRHPRFLKNQIKLEIQCSLRAFPGMILLTLPWFQAEVMGYSKLYDDVDQYGWLYCIASVPLSVSIFASDLSGALTLDVASCYSPIMASIGCIGGYTTRYSTRPSTSPITSGSVRTITVFLLFFSNLSDRVLNFSPYTLFVTCIPSCGRLPAIRSLSPLYFPLPTSPLSLHRPFCLCKLLVHSRKIALVIV
jgi:hypothetical protein